MTEDWNTGSLVLRYVDYALSAHDEWFGCTTSRLSGAVPETTQTIGKLMQFWTGRLHGTEADLTPEFFEATGISPDEPLPDNEQERHDYSAIAIAFAALSPQFLFR